MVGVRTSPWSQQATPTPTGSCCIVTSTRRRVRVWTRQGVLCSHGGMETNQKSLPLNREGKGGRLTLVGVHIFALIGFFAFPGPGNLSGTVASGARRDDFRRYRPSRQG